MFERFTDRARGVVVGAQIEARDLRQGTVGTEHLLLAMTREEGPAGTVLRAAGLGHDRVRDAVAGLLGTGPGGELDREGLASLGIDLDTVRDSVERTFGEGALDDPPTPRGRRFRRGGTAPSGTEHRYLSPRAKKVLELSLREAVARKDRHIGSEHLLLGLLREGEGLGAQALVTLGADLADLRMRVEQQVRRAA